MFKIKLITTELYYTLYMASSDYNNVRATMHNEEYNVPKTEFITFYGRTNILSYRKNHIVLEVHRDHIVTIEVLEQPK